MRLAPHEIAAITETAARVFGPDATVRLFGSRADDRRRGGDIDLYIEVEPGMADLRHHTDFSWQLQGRIGEQKIDVLLHERGKPLTLMHQEAAATGIVLDPAAHPVADVADRRRRVVPTSPVERLRIALSAAQAIGARLSWSRTHLAGLFPIDEDTMQGLSLDDQLRVDGLLHQYASLQDILSRRVFRCLLLVVGEGLSPMSARDVSNRMEALGLVKDAAAWTTMAEWRHRLSHEYPLAATEQVAALNAVYAAVDPLIATLERVKDYVARKSLLDEAG